MKKVSLLSAMFLVLFSYAHAGDSSFSGLRFGDKRVNIAVGSLENSNVNARSEARNGGRAVAGAIIADQNIGRKAGALNISAGILKGSHIRAKAFADGSNAKAYAGGVISTTGQTKR